MSFVMTLNYLYCNIIGIVFQIFLNNLQSKGAYWNNLKLIIIIVILVITYSYRRCDIPTIVGAWPQHCTWGYCWLREHHDTHHAGPLALSQSVLVPVVPQTHLSLFELFKKIPIRRGVVTCPPPVRRRTGPVYHPSLLRIARTLASSV